MEYQTPNFAIALLQLGRNNPERGAAIGVHPKTISRYLDGEIPDPIDHLMRKPDLILALYKDAVAMQQAQEV